MKQNAAGKINLLKAGPWLILLILILIIYSNWPKSEQATKLANPAKGAQETTDGQAVTGDKSETKESQAQILSEMLNFRSKPDLNDKAIAATLSKGTVVKVLERQGKWLKVELSDGKVGYITSDPKLVRIMESP